MSGSFGLSFADVGPAIVLTIPLAHATRKAGIGMGWTFAAVTVCVAAMGLPIFDVTVGGYVRAYTGNLSVVSMVVFANIIARCTVGRGIFDPRSQSTLLVLGAVAGVFLYPWALGAAPFDPYALGYNPRGLAGTVIALAVVCWFVSLRGAAVTVLISIVAYHLRLYGSANLWDYLIDPWVVIIGLFILGRGLAASLLTYRSNRNET